MSGSDDLEIQNTKSKFRRIQEELRSILRYEEDAARVLSGDEDACVTEDNESPKIDAIAPEEPLEDALASAYDPEDENFDSGNEVFPYFSDGEIIDSADGDDESVFGSSSVSTPAKKIDSPQPEEAATDILVDVDNENLDDITQSRLLEDLATLELRKAALASIGPNLDNATESNKSVENISQVSVKKSGSRRMSQNLYPSIAKSITDDEDDIDQSEVSKTAENIIRSTDNMRKYQRYIETVRLQDDTAEIAKWEQQVELILKNNIKLEKTRSRTTSTQQSIASVIEDVVVLSSDTEDDIAITSEWIVIDEAIPANDDDISNSVENVVEIKSEINEDEAVIHSVQESLVFEDELLNKREDSEHDEDIDTLREQLLISIAKKRTIATPQDSDLNPAELKSSEPVPDKPIEAKEIEPKEKQPVEKEVTVANDTTVSLVVPCPDTSNDRQVYLSSRNLGGPPRRFVIRVSNDSSDEDEAVQSKAPSSSDAGACSAKVSSFIKNMRMQTSQNKLSGDAEVKPVDQPKQVDNSFLQNTRLLHRKIIIEQNEIGKEENDLRRQQSSLARLKFGRERRVEKLHKMLSVIRKQQQDIEMMSKRIDSCKSVLETREKQMEKRKRIFTRKKELLFRAIRLGHKRSAPQTATNAAVIKKPRLAPVDQETPQVDPFVPLCPYSLHGTCNESACEYQHLNFPPQKTVNVSAPVPSTEVVDSVAVVAPQYTSANRIPEKLGLTVRAYCKVCRVYVTASTQHLRSDRKCAGCIEEAEKKSGEVKEVAWLTMLHHALCRAEALRMVEVEPGGSAVLAERKIGSELGDLALAALPESLPIIQHSLFLRRAARVEPMPLGLLKPLLSRTKMASLVWQCLPMVPESSVELLRYTLSLKDLRTTDDAERWRLLMTLVQLEEEVSGVERCGETIREMLNHESAYPVATKLDMAHRALLWLSLVHLAARGCLPPGNHWKPVDDTVFDQLSWPPENAAEVAGVLTEALRDVLQVEDAAGLVEKMKGAGDRSDAEVKKLVFLYVEVAELKIEQVLQLVQVFDGAYDLVRRLPRLSIDQLEDQSLSAVVATCCQGAHQLIAEGQQHEAEQLLLTMVRWLYRGCSAASTADGSALLLHYLGVSPPDRHNRLWAPAEPLCQLNPDAQALCLSAPVLLSSINCSVEQLRVRALSSPRFLLFSSVLLHHWHTALGDTAQYEEFLCSMLQQAVLTPLGSTLRLLSSLNPVCAHLLSSSQRYRLATRTLDRLNWSRRGESRSVAVLQAVCANLCPEHSLQLCEHALLICQHWRLWSIAVDAAEGAGLTNTRQLELLSRACAAAPRCRRLWLRRLRLARTTGRGRTVEHVVERMRAVKLDPAPADRVI